MSTRTIVLTGMHRSGTSLVARYLWESGLHMGGDFVQRNIGNPLGYYEDREFVEFHRRVLANHGAPEFPTNRSALEFELHGWEMEEARKLVAARSHLTTWGWKDPRTSLFLDCWDDCVENGSFLFLIRHPLKVVDSLVDRGTDRAIVKFPIRGLKSWYVYNKQLLRFYCKYPDRCIVWDIERLVTDTRTFDESMREAFDIDLSVEGKFSAYFDRHAFHTQIRSERVNVIRVLHWITYRRCLNLYRDLIGLARGFNGS